MMRDGTWNYMAPYYGYDSGNHAEGGFLLTIGMVQRFSGIGWNELFILMPLAITAMAVVLAYFIGRVFNAGLTSALFTAMLPITLRFLGLGFLVPLSLGFVIILALLLLILRFHSMWTLPILLVLSLYLVFLHPPSALVGIIVIGSCGLAFLIAKRWRDGLALISIPALTLVFALFMPILWTSSVFSNLGFGILGGGRFFLPEMNAFSYLKMFGFWLYLLGFIGAVILAKEWKSRGLPLIFSVGAIGGLALSFRYWINLIGDVQALYDRTVFLFFGTLALLAGKGASWSWNISRPATAVVLATAIGLSLYGHATTPYYHIVNDQEYQDFVWIHDNVNSTYERAILDPWKAVVFGPVAGKLVYYQIGQGPDSSMDDITRIINNFFQEGCSNTTFLIDNGITIVYTSGIVNNPSLVKVHPRIYLFE
jgi:hypothetical protein